MIRDIYTPGKKHWTRCITKIDVVARTVNAERHTKASGSVGKQTRLDRAAMFVHAFDAKLWYHCPNKHRAYTVSGMGDDVEARVHAVDQIYVCVVRLGQTCPQRVVLGHETHVMSNRPRHRMPRLRRCARRDIHRQYVAPAVVRVTCGLLRSVSFSKNCGGNTSNVAFMLLF